RLVSQPALDVLVLEAGGLLVVLGDAVEGGDDFRLELGFHRRKRHRALGIVLVVLVVLAVGRHFAVLVGSGGGSAVGGRLRRGTVCRRVRRTVGGRHVVVRRRGLRRLGIGAGIGRVEIDDVAQEDLALGKLVAP